MSIIKPLRASSVSIGVGTAFNSLASDASLLAGAQTNEFSDTDRSIDVLLSGTVKLGTSPTAGKQVDIWVFACKDASSDYIDTITGAGAAAKTLTSANIKFAGGKLLKSMHTDAVTGRELEFSNESIAERFGGNVPSKFVLFLTHDSAVALDSSAGFVVNALKVQYEAA